MYFHNVWFSQVGLYKQDVSNDMQNTPYVSYSEAANFQLQQENYVET